MAGVLEEKSIAIGAGQLARYHSRVCENIRGQCVVVRTCAEQEASLESLQFWNLPIPTELLEADAPVPPSVLGRICLAAIHPCVFDVVGLAQPPIPIPLIRLGVDPVHLLIK